MKYEFEEDKEDGETVNNVSELVAPTVYYGNDFEKCFRGKNKNNIRVKKFLRASHDLGIRVETPKNFDEIELAQLWHFLKSRGERCA